LQEEIRIKEEIERINKADREAKALEEEKKL
jgi:hypothetical protein